MINETEHDYFEMEESFDRAKALVRYAKARVDMLHSNQKYYEVFGKYNEQKKDLAHAEKVLERCKGILSKVREAYYEAETKFHNQL